MTNDSINHPSHYNQYEGIEVIDLVEQMNFNKGNAVKYITRAGFKNPETEIEDLKKAQWYIEREIQRLHKKVMDVSPVENKVDDQGSQNNYETLQYILKNNITGQDLPSVCGNRLCNMVWNLAGVDYIYIKECDSIRCYRCGWSYIPKKVYLIKENLPKLCPTCHREWREEGLSHSVRLEMNKCACLYCGSELDIRMLLDAN